MTHRAGAIAVLSSILLLSSGLSSPAHAGPQGFALELRDVLDPAVDLFRPVGLVNAGDGSGRLFLVQQSGEVLVLQPGASTPTVFLDLTDVDCCGERGLLGLAFHPDYATNGHFFVYYSANPEAGEDFGDSVVSRFTVSANPDVADSASEVRFLTQPQPRGNHNGGQLAFGPDGFLYIALGDGGGGGDPSDQSQDLSTLLGKILRLYVDQPDPPNAYTIPADNPFKNTPGARDEIWAYGLRNPWRFSFDRLTGDLFIADVGQRDVEEVDFEPAGSPGGVNYGWRCYEGSQEFDTTGCGPVSGYTFPILEYGHDAGNCSVTGGFRYRGADSLFEGVYVFADYCTGTVWGAAPGCNGVWTSSPLLESGLLVTSFGEGEDGELYVLGFDDGAGRLFRLEAVPTAAVFADGFESGDFRSWPICRS